VHFVLACILPFRLADLDNGAGSLSLSLCV